jgi:hypothetical protein
MPSNRRSFFQQIAVAGLGCELAGAAQPRPIPCRIVDARTGRAIAARLRLIDSNGRECVPAGHPETISEYGQEGDVRFQSRRYSYVDGGCLLPAKSLPLRFEVVKGYEYAIARGEIRPDNLADGTAVIPLQRWSSLPDAGWYSGDIHIHNIAPGTCRLEMDAEDLHVANILTSDFTFDRDQFEGAVNRFSSRERVIYVGQEFRNNHLGHICLLGPKQLVEPVKPMRSVHYPLLMDVCDQAHARGGYVSWAHFPAWPGAENPLDVALEKLDGLEILSQVDPRQLVYNMAQLVPDLSANNGLRLWYRYLNCGFRLTATAGTDKMTNFVTVGANRVYAHVEGDFTYANWIAALKQGRTFVSNSPMLRLTVNGREPGTTLNLDSRKQETLEIHASAESQIPYHHLEIICNGEVIAEASPSGERSHAEIRLELALTRSCWIAARAHEDLTSYGSQGIDFAEVHNARGTLVSSYYGMRRPEGVFAHSSPVYVIRDGKPIRSWADADYYIRYLDNAIAWLKKDARFAKPGDLEASLEAFRRGRAVYVARAAEARRSS